MHDTLILALVVGLRLVVPLAIPRYPIPAGLAALVIDGVDQTILQATTKLNLDGYQNYDKALDMYYLSIEYLATLRNWTNPTALGMGRLLYYYRLVGSLLFELLHLRSLLLLFPNTFEYFFLFYEAVRLRWNPRRMSPALVIGAAFAIWVVIKVPQEYWIHVAQLDATDAIKQHIFGAPLDARWSDVLSDNVGLTLLLAAAVVALVVLARWLITTRLPPADWPLSFDADAHGRDVSAEEATAAREAAARRLFGAPLYEKIAFVGLLTVIFTQMLPTAHVTVAQTAAGAIVVIVVNAALSAWLVRRSVVWRSAAVEFVVMALANGLTALVFVRLLGRGPRSLDLPT
ncbi:MAG TPA: hypothetical protein VFX03_04195, partial [Thermomicrobiales bacterium]|nr:hypothetical protein [Thermomicrobiales bacterium]